MRRPFTVIAWIIGVPLALLAALPLLVYGGALFESFDDLYGVYRTGDGKTATINVNRVGYFHYRDSAERCIDFWPMANRTNEILARGHPCGEWGAGERWSARRDGDASIILTHDDGSTIKMHRLPVTRRLKRGIIDYPLRP